MSEYTTPISMAFELQRTTIDQSQAAFERGVEFQRDFTTAVLGGLDAQRDVQARGIELARMAVHNYLDAVEATMPGTGETVADTHAVVDDQYDALLDVHAETFDELRYQMDEGFETYDEFVSEYMYALQDQVDMLLEAHEELEHMNVEGYDRAREQFEEAQYRFEGQVEELKALLDEQSARFEGRIEEQADRLSMQLEDLQSQLREVQQRAPERTGA